MSETRQPLWKRTLDKVLGLTTSVVLMPSLKSRARQEEELFASQFPMVDIDKPANPEVLERTEAAHNMRRMRNIQSRMLQQGIPDTLPDVWPERLTTEQSARWNAFLETQKAIGVSEAEAREKLRRKNNVSIVPAGGGYRSSDEHPRSPFGTVQENTWSMRPGNTLADYLTAQSLYLGKKNLP